MSGESRMSRFKKNVIKLLDIIERHIPVVMFVVVFIMYVVMIIYRYILKKAVFEFNELCQVLYMTCALLGASYASRKDSHVIFPLVYDNIPPKAQKVFRMISDAIIVSICVLLWKPSLEATIWISRKKTEVLGISFGWMYSVFMIFITLTACYYAYNFIKELGTPAVAMGEEVKEEPEGNRM
jgi:TRAP-type C4-dicarboxylate transport system permease small subunit